MKTLILDNKNWQLGSSTDDESDFSGVVGISPDRKGQNQFLGKGDSLVGQPVLSNLTGTLTANIIAGIVDPTTTSRDSILISANGKIYSTSTSSFTNAGEDASHNTEYVKGFTDLKYFKGSFYATRKEGIIKFEANLTTFDYVWWVTTMGKTALNINGPHPMEIVEDTLYIADLNMIHTWDGTTAVYNQVALPTGYTITALKIHTDGRYLKVFATNTFSYYHTDKIQSKLYLFDTLTLEFINEYSLEEQVEGVINWGGNCMCIYGNNLGYFDGAGLKLIRKIELAGSAEDPIYSPVISIFNNTVLFPSKDYLNDYGDVSGKGNIFFYPFALSAGDFMHFSLPISTSLCLIQYVNSIGAYKIAKIDFSTAPSLDVQTTKINLGGKIWIRKVDLFFDALPTNSYVTLYNRQDDGNVKIIGSASNAVDGGITKKTMFCNVLAESIQPYLSGGGATLYIKKMNIQYESAE